jgi:hypothetical protein
MADLIALSLSRSRMIKLIIIEHKKRIYFGIIEPVLILFDNSSYPGYDSRLFNLLEKPSL